MAPNLNPERFQVCRGLKVVAHREFSRNQGIGALTVEKQSFLKADL